MLSNIDAKHNSDFLAGVDAATEAVTFLLKESKVPETEIAFFISSMLIFIGITPPTLGGLYETGKKKEEEKGLDSETF